MYDSDFCRGVAATLLRRAVDVMSACCCSISTPTADAPRVEPSLINIRKSCKSRPPALRELGFQHTEDELAQGVIEDVVQTNQA